MHINDLPEDITIPIIRYVSPSLANNLAAISVCQRWRRAGIPAVYRSMQISFDEKSNSTVTENSHACIKSNASIIATTGNKHVVKHLDIRLTYSHNLTFGLYAIVDFISNNSSCLNSITSLTLRVSDTSRISPNQLSGKRVDMEFLQEVAGRIQKLVPHIAKLDAHGMCSSPFLENFYGLLIATYSGQLGRMVIRNKVVAMPGMLHFSKLTRLVITINAESVGYLPYIHAESLVFLSMKKVPIDFTWSTNGSSVVFSNLHDLDVEYGWYNVKDRLIDQKIKAAVHSCTLLFPAIKRMRIRGIMNHFPVMLYGKFASDMELVDIVGTKKAIEYVLVGKVPQARNLVMDASLDNYMLDTNELYAIESLSNSSKINLVLKLNILRRSVIPMLDNIALSRLTELCILPTMEINKTMDLISRLPCLEYLRICLGQTEVSSDEMRPSETVGPQNMCEKPISTSLIIISLQFSASNWVSDNNIHAFKRLCLAIPSLSKIHAFQIPKKLIAEFVEEYKHDYPHLAYTRMYA